MRGACFVTDASSGTLTDLPAKTTARVNGFKPQQLQTQSVLLCQRLQFLAHGVARGKQTIELWCLSECHGLFVDHRSLPTVFLLDQLQAAEFFHTPKTLVVQRALRFDHLRLKQQSADFSRCFYGFNPACLRQHARFIGIA